MRGSALAFGIGLALAAGQAAAQQVQCSPGGSIQASNWREEAQQAGNGVTTRYYVDLAVGSDPGRYAFTVTVGNYSAYPSGPESRIEGQVASTKVTVLLATHIRTGRFGTPAPMIGTVQAATRIACRPLALAS